MQFKLKFCVLKIIKTEKVINILCITLVSDHFIPANYQVLVPNYTEEQIYWGRLQLCPCMDYGSRGIKPVIPMAEPPILRY